MEDPAEQPTHFYPQPTKVDYLRRRCWKIVVREMTPDQQQFSRTPCEIFSHFPVMADNYLYRQLPEDFVDRQISTLIALLEGKTKIFSRIFFTKFLQTLLSLRTKDQHMDMCHLYSKIFTLLVSITLCWIF